MYIILFVMVAMLTNCSHDDENNALVKKIKTGDLLFQNTGSADVDKAIKDVTKTEKATNYTHVGIAVIKDGKMSVLEAITDGGVVITNLETFLARSKNAEGKPLVSVYRLVEPFNKHIDSILDYGKDMMGKPYDSLFIWDDDAIYCSELVYKVIDNMLNRNGISAHPFVTHAMTFKGGDGKILPYWRSYYDRLNHEVPEGWEGTNPNLMASSEYIEFIVSFF